MDTFFNSTDFLPDEIAGCVPTIRVIAMPSDANPSGDVFGGWILSQMDLAGGAHAYQIALHRVVTVGVNAMTFHQPVHIGDEVSFYTKLERIGKTSISIHIDSWAFRRNEKKYDKVTEGLFTYVKIDGTGKPVEIKS